MIPQETIDRIKQEINLADYVQSRGVKLSKNGKEYKGLCPFHEDTNPSFSVNPIMNLWFCHSCNDGGDVIKFVEMKDKLSFQESVRKLSGNGFATQPGTTLVDSSQLTVPPGPAARAGLLSKVFEFYHKTFLEDHRGLEYLVSRGIENAELFKVVKIGFANGSLVKTLSDDQKKELREIGVLNKS
ncbi:MAG: hypothetical protein JW976_05485, partial [Syntrophaceae bacterium]|nr:hypothetical protein [Syntrophaceae bacterium]